MHGQQNAKRKKQTNKKTDNSLRSNFISHFSRTSHNE